MKKGTCYGGLPAKMSHQERLALAKDAGLDGVQLSGIESVDEAARER